MRYSRAGICSLRHVSTIEMMAATRGPACSLPSDIAGIGSQESAISKLPRTLLSKCLFSCLIWVNKDVEDKGLSRKASAWELPGIFCRLFSDVPLHIVFCLSLLARQLNILTPYYGTEVKLGQNW
jgi:hypothetical protein